MALKFAKKSVDPRDLLLLSLAFYQILPVLRTWYGNIYLSTAVHNLLSCPLAAKEAFDRYATAICVTHCRRWALELALG